MLQKSMLVRPRTEPSAEVEDGGLSMAAPWKPLEELAAVLLEEEAWLLLLVVMLLLVLLPVPKRPL